MLDTHNHQLVFHSKSKKNIHDVNNYFNRILFNLHLTISYKISKQLLNFYQKLVLILLILSICRFLYQIYYVIFSILEF